VSKLSHSPWYKNSGWSSSQVTISFLADVHLRFTIPRVPASRRRTWHTTVHGVSTVGATACNIHPMHQPIKAQRRGDWEAEFRPLLISCLNQCQNGSWSLFGQNDYADAPKYLDWNDGQQFRETAPQIREFESRVWSTKPTCQAFLAPLFSARTQCARRTEVSQAFAG
jgi:hypothetical protein